MRYIAEDATLRFKFTTRQFSSGAPHALAGTPSLAVYPEDSTTQVTAGITLTADYDSVTGLNQVVIDLSADAGYVAGKAYQVVIAAGTVDSVSVVGEVVYEFYIHASGGLEALITRGLLALPAAAADAAGGLPISDAGGLDIDARLDAAITSRMASYTQPTGFLAATFPTTVASTTNITAGTITTVTNLTNAPTSGDFTATMKTSIGTAVAASAVASVTGNVGGNVAGSVGSVTAGVTVTTNNDKTGYTASTVSDKTGYSLSATGSAAMTESYAAAGAAPTIVQILYEIRALMAEKGISSTTLTTKKLDGATTAATYTLDDATTPSSITRAT